MIHFLWYFIVFHRPIYLPIINTFFRMNFIGMKSKAIIFCCLLTILSTATAQIKSPKRGIGWDEKTQKLSNAPIDKLLPGVSWIYTWGENPQGVAHNLGNEIRANYIHAQETSEPHPLSEAPAFLNESWSLKSGIYTYYIYH